MTHPIRSEKAGSFPRPHSVCGEWQARSAGCIYSIIRWRPFGGFSKHPGKLIEKWHHKSTAAGAYGIIEDKYDEAVKAHIVHDFSERSQDAIAVSLITRPGAQWDIWDGKLDSAFIKLNRIWSSLPGGSQQELTSGEAKKYFWNRLGEAAP